VFLLSTCELSLELCDSGLMALGGLLGLLVGSLCSLEVS
jgi:hypothetical protein